MRVNVNTRRSQTMPGMKKRMFTSASKASKPYMNKARGYLKREARRQYDTATAAIKAELEAKIVGGTIDEIEKHLSSYALKVRNPLGAGGRNLTPNKNNWLTNQLNSVQPNHQVCSHTDLVKPEVKQMIRFYTNQFVIKK